LGDGSFVRGNAAAIIGFLSARTAAPPYGSFPSATGLRFSLLGPVVIVFPDGRQAIFLNPVKPDLVEKQGLKSLPRIDRYMTQ
jgi:hypothetical protein